MADGQIQLPPDATGHALRTQELEPTTTLGGDDGLLHQQVVTLADSQGNIVGDALSPPMPVIEDGDSVVINLLERILMELKRHTLILANMADNYVSDGDIDTEDT